MYLLKDNRGGVPVKPYISLKQATKMKVDKGKLFIINYTNIK